MDIKFTPWIAHSIDQCLIPNEKPCYQVTMMSNPKYKWISNSHHGTRAVMIEFETLCILDSIQQLPPRILYILQDMYDIILVGLKINTRDRRIFPSFNGFCILSVIVTIQNGSRHLGHTALFFNGGGGGWGPLFSMPNH